MYGWQQNPLPTIQNNLVAWLTVSGNLTQKLAQLNQYRFCKISQNYTTLPTEENQYLQQTQQQGLVRNVIHYAENNALVLARTVISDNLYHAFQNDFDTLENKPIGQTLLYHRHDLIRSNFEFGQVTVGIITDDFAKDVLLPDKIDARRSLFGVNDSTLMITELFLPDINHYELP